jgi:hypothetical protein
MTFQASTGRVGIGTVPETLLHISAGTSGDAVLLLEADTDNNNENDQPAIELRQDGGAVSAMLGFMDGKNELQIRSTDKIEFYSGPSGAQQLATSIDTDGNLHVTGDVQIDGELIVIKEAYLSIPPAAFRPFQQIDRPGIYLGNVIYATVDASIRLVAPVNLPHGAKIIKITCWWEDNVDENLYLKLYRYSLDEGDTNYMAQIDSYWNEDGRHCQYAPDPDSYYASDTIEYDIVDNNEYAYVVEIGLPVSEDSTNLNAFYGVRIKYSYTP